VAVSVSNEQIYDVLLSLKEDMGAVKQATRDNGDHTLAVSRKADAIRSELVDHAHHHPAYGMKTARRGWSDLVALIAVLISAAGVWASRHPK